MFSISTSREDTSNLNEAENVQKLKINFQVLTQNISKQTSINFNQEMPNLLTNKIFNDGFQIFIQNFKNKPIIFIVNEKDSIKSLKDKIQIKSQIPLEDQKLYFGGKYLLNDKTIKDYGIVQGSTIFMVVSVLGGLFSFNSLEKKINKQFSKIGPAYRAVIFGLNLHSKCNNASCEAYNKKIIIQKGFGKFNISKQICKCKCPICLTICGEATNFGYFKTWIKVEGKQKNGKVIKWQQNVDKQSYTTFENNDQDLREWIYLQIKTKPIQLKCEKQIQRQCGCSDSSDSNDDSC